MSQYAPKPQKLFSVLKWALFYAALWALLSGNEGWGFGALFISIALYCKFKSGMRGATISLKHLPAFLLYFLQRLVVGGVDVAIRTLSPTPAINPAWVSYSMQSSSSSTQLALSAIVGLLPGTLAANIENNTMLLHLLDSRQDWQRDVAKLEQHLLRLVGTHTGADIVTMGKPE